MTRAGPPRPTGCARSTVQLVALAPRKPRTGRTPAVQPLDGGGPFLGVWASLVQRHMSAEPPKRDAHYEERLADVLAARMLELLVPVFEELAATRPGGGLVDAATLARELGVSRQFVYDHAEELGGLRFGSGRRPRLRFELATAKRAWGHITDGRPQGRVRETPPTRRRRQAPTPALLPLRGPPVQ